MHELVEIRVALLGRVHAEGMQQVERVAGRKPALGERRPKRPRGGNVILLAEKRSLEPVEAGELLVRAQHGTVGNVVGAAHESVKGEDHRPVPARNKLRRDGKILVAMGLRSGPDRCLRSLQIPMFAEPGQRVRQALHVGPRTIAKITFRLGGGKEHPIFRHPQAVAGEERVARRHRAP